MQQLQITVDGNVYILHVAPVYDANNIVTSFQLVAFEQPKVVQPQLFPHDLLRVS